MPYSTLTSDEPNDTANRMRSLLAVAQAISSHSDLPSLFSELTRILSVVVPFDYLSLSLHDPETDLLKLTLVESSDPDTVPIPSDMPPFVEPKLSLMYEVWTTQEPLLIRIDDENRFPVLMEFLRKHQAKSIWVLPLTTPRKRYGTLAFTSHRILPHREPDLDFLIQAAQYVAVAVENTMQHEQLLATQSALEKEHRQLRLLIAVSQAITSHLTLNTLLPSIDECLKQLCGQSLTALWVPASEPGWLRTYGGFYSDIQTNDQEFRLPINDSPSGEAFRTRRTVRLRFEELQRLTTEPARKLIEMGAKSFCAVPLLLQDKAVGVLSLIGLNPDAFPEDLTTLLEQAAKPIAIAVTHAESYRELEAMRHRLTVEKSYLEEEIRTEGHFEEIIGDSPPLREVLRQVEVVAPTDSVVMILGETGTGKELIARAVHRLSRRVDHTFVKLNCASIPMGLLESELFGHEKGAFTGAIERRIGRFELAHQGTLFLDEVGDIPPELQPKLLRVLQEQEFERLGSTKTIRVNVRLIAATHRDLNQMVADGEFRADLFYRLHVFPLRMPSLRDRSDDIPKLVRYFVRKYARLMHRQIEHIATETMHQLCQYPWPGNVRELEHLIERAVILSPGRELHVPLAELQSNAPSVVVPTEGTLESIERETIVRTLEACRWVIGGVNGAATKLGLKRTTLLSRMRKLNLQRPGE